MTTSTVITVSIATVSALYGLFIAFNRFRSRLIDRVLDIESRLSRLEAMANRAK